MAAINVSKFSVENTDLLLPSHVSLVSGLDGYTATKLDVFNNNVLIPAINALGNTYVTKTGTAAKATADAAGNNIANTYVKKTDTIANATNAVNADNAGRATNDSQGNAIINTYAKKQGSEPNLSVGYASDAGVARCATFDQSGQHSIQEYILVIEADGSTISFKRGNGASDSFTMPNTTYPLASITADGLMSKDDKIKLNTVEEGAQNFVPSDITWDFDDYNSVVNPGFYRIDNFPDTGKYWAHCPVGESQGTHYMLVFNSRKESDAANGIAWQFLFRYAFDGNHINDPHALYFRAIWPTHRDGPHYPKWSKFTPALVEFATS